MPILGGYVEFAWVRIELFDTFHTDYLRLDEIPHGLGLEPIVEHLLWMGMYRKRD